MHGLHEWFLDGPSGRSLSVNLPGIILLLLLLSLGGEELVQIFSLTQNFSSGTIDVLEFVQKYGFFPVIGMFPIAALFEEGCFRFVPLTVAAWLFSAIFDRPKDFIAVALVAIVSSVLFGLAHGGVGNILVQGIGGLVFSVVFLKWSSLGKEPLLGLIASTTVHASFNIVLTSLLVVGILK